MPPFFMATTIKVDSNVADWTWQDDQALDPETNVELVVMTDELTKGYPVTAIPAPNFVKAPEPAQ